VKLFRIRKGRIPESDRQLFERCGNRVLESLLASGFTPPVGTELQRVYASTQKLGYAADWLTEQYDRAERWENWSLLMEIAITVFVLIEVVFSVLNFLGIHN
jgi:hypothetical protein